MSEPNVSSGLYGEDMGLIPYRSRCLCSCHQTGAIHMFACCQPDPVRWAQTCGNPHCEHGECRQIRYRQSGDPSAMVEPSHIPTAWISCEERMPEKLTPVLVWERGGDRACCAEWIAYKIDGKDRIAWHQDSEHVEADSGNYGNGAVKDHRELDVTHWQPLPPPPTPEAP